MNEIQKLEQELSELKERLNRLEAPPNTTTPERILDFLEKEFSVPKKDILSNERTKRIKEIRHLAFWIAYNRENMNTLQIGSVFNRNHASVLNGLERMNDLLYFEKGMIDKKYTDVIAKYENA